MSDAVASCSDARRGRGERGAVLVEFALTSIIFMMLVWGALSYGVMFWVKSTITHAAAEGARAAIRSTDPVAGAKASAEGILDSSMPTGKAGYAKPITPTTGPCSYDTSQTCITVTVTYPYSAHPVVPSIPLLSFLPSQLRSTSVIQVP
ncbi:MAG: pilus assembly protein [Actinobacteria bacterium]|nr:pilus assembly protein [Actinomycetota bacterium]